jgi:hypothetical protein
MSQDNEEHFPRNINPQINQVIQNQENHLPNQQQNNQNQQQFNQNQQQFNQNQQQFNQNQQQFNQNQQQFNPNQFAFFQNQMPFFNMNPMFNPQMTQEQRQQMEQQQKMQNEMMRLQAIQIGKTLLEQKKIMEQIHKNRAERENRRKTCEMVIFFKYNDDILPINIKADQFLFELLQEYKTQSGNQNVKFYFHGEELVFNTNSPTVLHEINGLRTGEEIVVKSSQ